MPVAGLVLWPQTVAERLDDVISRDSDVRRSVLEHLRNRTKHARSPRHTADRFS